jgi:hypothetical protein
MRLVESPTPELGAPGGDQFVVVGHRSQNSLCVNAFRAERARSEGGTLLQSIVLLGYPSTECWRSPPRSLR